MNKREFAAIKERAVDAMRREIERLERIDPTAFVGRKKTLKDRIKDARSADARFVATRVDRCSRFRFGVLDLKSVEFKNGILMDEWHTITCKNRKEAVEKAERANIQKWLDNYSDCDEFGQILFNNRDVVQAIFERRAERKKAADDYHGEKDKS